nr:hypothetical protein [uncultured Lichenicoccus sp.]
MLRFLTAASALLGLASVLTCLGGCVGRVVLDATLVANLPPHAEGL